MANWSRPHFGSRELAGCVATGRRLAAFNVPVLMRCRNSSVRLLTTTPLMLRALQLGPRSFHEIPARQARLCVPGEQPAVGKIPRAPAMLVVFGLAQEIVAPRALPDRHFHGVRQQNL